MYKHLQIILLLFTEIILAQAIEADRPDQTETPAIVPVGMIQVENGFAFQKNSSNSYSYTIPSTLWKYGINKKIEARLITELLLENNSDTLTSGLMPLSIGFKANLYEENGFIPKTSLIVQMILPKFASENYKSNFFSPEFRFTMQHNLSEKNTLGYNLGSEWNSTTGKVNLIYTLTTGYSITKKIGFYIELYGFSPQNEKAIHSFDGGFTFLINNNFMVDLSSSIGLTTTAPKHYFALGLSFRI